MQRQTIALLMMTATMDATDTMNEALQDPDSELDPDLIENETWQAVDAGKTKADCPYPEGSSNWSVWMWSFDQRKHAPYVLEGENAARNGLPISACPVNVAESLQDAWKTGWSIVRDGPFPGFKDVTIEFRVTKHDV